ncbi:Clp1/GlmU family protein [Microvirga tunisiensis]|uniref:Clp1/GlmU family protein n=1 Tax=Microvirga tunisiensis TaxID=2108360 RepID=UPI001386F334|nr:polynucleotide 5'-hydroxyl-kinase [Microvirga tunisiensis]
MPDVSLHVPPAWDAAAQYIRHHGLRRILVVGEKDTGKSTFCRFLAQAATRSGCGTALLDTDVGQKLVGPPACVSMDDAHGHFLAFVGSTNPVQGWSRLIEGARRLAQRTDADCLIVNTSGLLAGPGRRLKAAKIDALRPDLLIAVGTGQSLEEIAQDVLDPPILRVPSSPEARHKTAGERRTARHKALRQYFSHSGLLKLKSGMLTPSDVQAPLPAGLLLGLSDKAGQDLGFALLHGSEGGA